MEFHARVAQYYRSRGYEVRERVKVRGQSGAIWAVDMVAQGQLGNLLVTFGGHDGVDDADIIQIKRVAKDIGSSAVVASPDLAPELARLAQREGVAILDGTFPDPKRPEILDEDPLPSAADLHPWPNTGVAHDPARTALRSVALDDLLGDDASPDAPPATRANPAQPTRADSPAASALWNKNKDAAANSGTKEQSPKGKFSWLADSTKQSVGQGGGYEFPDPEPVAAKGDDAAATSTANRQATAQGGSAGSTGRDHEASPATDSSRKSMTERERVLADVRERVGRTPSAPQQDGFDWEAWKRPILQAATGGVVAAILLWMLLRFGP